MLEPRGRSGERLDGALKYLHATFPARGEADGPERRADRAQTAGALGQGQLLAGEFERTLGLAQAQQRNCGARAPWVARGVQFTEGRQSVAALEQCGEGGFRVVSQE